MTALHTNTAFDKVIDLEGRINPRLIAETYHLNVGEVSVLSGLPKSTLERRARAFGKRSQMRLRQMMSVMSRAESLTEGNRMRAYAWYRSTPIPSLGNLTAQELVAQGKGEAVMSYLNRLAEGGYA